jgi:hypothetical protein
MISESAASAGHGGEADGVSVGLSWLGRGRRAQLVGESRGVGERVAAGCGAGGRGDDERLAIEEAEGDRVELARAGRAAAVAEREQGVSVACGGGGSVAAPCGGRRRGTGTG